MATIRQAGETLLVVLAVSSATGVGASVVKREFFSGSHAAAATDHAPTRFGDWQKYAAVGHRMGPANAPVTIVEFADFECPVCGHFVTRRLEAVEREFPGQVAVVFRHFPLDYHRFAYPTARAAECAAAQGRFAEFYGAIYHAQDSLGLKPYSEFARQSGVNDLAAFDQCNRTPGRVPAIEMDMEAARAIGANGTPTVLVNDLLFLGAPDSVQLHAAIAEILKAREKP
jgi:protein-disulfide isomerase